MDDTDTTEIQDTMIDLIKVLFKNVAKHTNRSDDCPVQSVDYCITAVPNRRAIYVRLVDKRRYRIAVDPVKRW